MCLYSNAANKTHCQRLTKMPGIGCRITYAMCTFRYMHVHVHVHVTTNEKDTHSLLNSSLLKVKEITLINNTASKAQQCATLRRPQATSTGSCCRLLLAHDVHYAAAIIAATYCCSAGEDSSPVHDRAAPLTARLAAASGASGAISVAAAGAAACAHRPCHSSCWWPHTMTGPLLLPTTMFETG